MRERAGPRAKTAPRSAEAPGSTARRRASTTGDIAGAASVPRPARAALGTRAEAAVVAWLRERDIEILGTNVRAGRLEVDVLARDGEVVLVIEVRTRGAGAWQRALDSIDGKKQMRLRHAGERLWQQRFAKRRDVNRMRFDCASVSFDDSGAATIEYVKAAF